MLDLVLKIFYIGLISLDLVMVRCLSVGVSVISDKVNIESNIEWRMV